MAGNASNADGDEPEFDDDEGGGESTVAMTSPSFDPATSPISVPPLPITPPHGVPPASPFSPMQMPPTAPVGFKPMGGPLPARQAPPSAPLPTKPSAPKAPMGGVPFSGAPGSARTGPRRPQTVVGLAPPPAGAPRPPAAGPSQQRPPSQEDPPHGSAKEDGPTMARTTEDSLALFGLDDGLSDAARAAMAVGPKPARHSPHSPPNPAGFPSPSSNIGGSGFGGSSPRPAPPPIPALNDDDPPTENEAATVAVPRDELERARREVSAETPMEAPGEEESTRAVPREELLRGQDAHVVVGDDAVGEDATLAVSPGDNDANSQRFGLAQTMGLQEGGFPAPHFPPFGDPNAGQGGMGQMPMSGHGMGGGAPPPRWIDPSMPTHQAWNPSALGQPMQGQMQPGSGQPMQGQMQPGSGQPMQGQMQPGSNPHMPASNPHMQAGQQMPPSGQMPMHGMPMHGMHQNPMQGPASYPGQQGMHSPQNWPAPAPKRAKMSGQILLLAVVGVICLAIFITGIVLFATTKF